MKKTKKFNLKWREYSRHFAVSIKYSIIFALTINFKQNKIVR